MKCGQSANIIANAMVLIMRTHPIQSPLLPDTELWSDEPSLETERHPQKSCCY